MYDGVIGIAGCAFKTSTVALEIHPNAFLALTEWEEPAAKPVYNKVFVKGPPSKLNVSPKTAPICMDPVASVQVGCVGVNIGGAEVNGWVFKVMVAREEMQPKVFLAFTV